MIPFTCQIIKRQVSNVDPRKWVCVEAEEVITDHIGDLVILIMSSKDLAPKLHENFLVLAQ